MRNQITDRFLRSVELPKAGSILIRDTKQRGFGMRITKGGVKSFVFFYSVNGNEKRMVIGRYPDWTVARARSRVKDLRQQVDLGHDPLAERNEKRTAETVYDLWECYQEHHLPTLSIRNQKDQGAMWRDYILPRLGKKRLKEISHSDIDQLHSGVSAVGKVRANRVVEVIRKALNLSIRWGFIDKNPALGVRKNVENRRERYLTEEERDRLFSALKAEQDKPASLAIQLIALTGARLREVLEAEWDEFDLQNGIWVKPGSRTKQRRLHRIPLSQGAIDILKSLRKSATTRYLFPSSTGKPRSDLKRPWARIKKAAGLEGLRIHDLRHTYASILASNGTPLMIVGQQLGHTQAQTTMRYSHLYDEPLRQASDTVQKAYSNFFASEP